MPSLSQTRSGFERQLTLARDIDTFMMNACNKTVMALHGYTFEKKLGEGTYGKVVIAYSAHLRRRVAIKLIDKEKVNKSYLEKFLPRELGLIMSLKHPNVVSTLAIFGANTSKVYIVMELCAKGDLLTYINRRGGLSDHSSHKFFTQLCEGVQYLHSINIAHRDLKCENLLLDTFQNLKVCDFGFSKRLTYTGGSVVLSETYCGTSAYAAPEITRNSPYNPKVSDVWSMGVVLYVMFYASMPYDATNIRKMIETQTRHIIPFPQIPPVSSEAKVLIQRILNPVVEKRLTISNILQSSWMLHEERGEDKVEACTSNDDSQQEGPTDEDVGKDEHSKDNTDPGEGPSTAAPRP